MPTPWFARVERAVARWLGSGPGTGWVVAVSGGSDSVGLLRALHAIGPGLGLRLSVAHLDHGARGEAARADAAFVAALADSLGLPFDLGRWGPARAGHFEADARRARYAWLTETARARGASAVAVGHTRDDQAETILHRIVRGTGPRGLAGMRARRTLAPSGPGFGSVTLVRPLLKVARQEVRDSLAALGQSYRDDAGNADTARTRARIRHDLVPKLAADYNPAVADALVRLGALAGASARSVARRARAIERAATVEARPGLVLLSRPKLLQVNRFLRAEVLRRAWRRAGWPEAGMGAKHWWRLADLANRPKARASVGGGIEAETDADLLVLRRPAAGAVAVPASRVPLEIPGSAPWPGGRVVVVLDPDAPRDESIDLDRLSPPLYVRAAVPGDRFQPLGMGEHSKPLNDFFRGRGVARADRPSVPLLCDGLGIVWVVGHRIRNSVRRDERTRRVAGLRFEKSPDCQNDRPSPHDDLEE